MYNDNEILIRLSQMQEMAISQDLFDDPNVKILPDVQ